MAIAARARAELQERIKERVDNLTEDESGMGAFCATLITLLSE